MRSFWNLIFKIPNSFIFDLSHLAFSQAKKKCASCRTSLIFRIFSENFFWTLKWTLKLYDVYLNNVNINEIFSDSMIGSSTAFLLLRLFTRTLIESTRTWKIFLKKFKFFMAYLFQRLSRDRIWFCKISSCHMSPDWFEMRMISNSMKLRLVGSKNPKAAWNQKLSYN